MRLMSLVDLGSSESGHIPYDIIKCTLQVSFPSAFIPLHVVFLVLLKFIFFPCSLQIADDEVEGWVVKAITAKLLDCKIDQMNQIIIVR